MKNFTTKTCCFFVLIIISPYWCIAQNFADKSYYLIDSLDYNDLAKTEKFLLDSSLNLFHKATHDTDKINAINIIVEQSWDDNVWPKYNNWIHLFIQKKLKVKPSSEKIKNTLLNALAGALNNSGLIFNNQGNLEEALKCYTKSLEIKKVLNDKKGKALSLNNIGAIYSQQGNISKALKYYQESLKIREQINDLQGIAVSLNNIGTCFKNQGDISTALTYYLKSLNIKEKIGFKQGVSLSLSNIGIIYDEQGEIKKALEYYKRSLAIDKEIGNKKGVAASLNNLGYLYFNFGEKLCKKETIEERKKEGFKKALAYYKWGLEIYREVGNKIGIAASLAHIGSIYSEIEDSACNLPNNECLKQGLTTGLGYYKKSLKIDREIEDKKAETYCLIDIATIYLKLNQVNEAKKLAKKSLQIAQSIGYPANIKNASQFLVSLYEHNNNYVKAFEMQRLFMQMKDSLNSITVLNSTARQQIKYDYEKQKTIDDTAYEKRIAIEHQGKQQQQILFYIAGVALLIVIIFLAFVFHQYKTTQKQKKIIENQQLETEHQKEKVEKAHHQLAEKNNETLNSIRYAKLIQEALLKNEAYDNAILPEHFIFFKSKDIVSGDFYWILNKKGGTENFLYMAACDCTGHGVPGAFLTMMGTGFLNEISAAEKSLTPAEILNELRNRFIHDLSQTGKKGESKDGMDISVVRINLLNTATHTNIMWAGANNPLYIISKSNEGKLKNLGWKKNGIIADTNKIKVMNKDEANLYEITPNKQAIGYESNMTPFTNHELILEKEDLIYLFTDGFADQFGGEKGKKYKYMPFKKQLLDNFKLPTANQGKKLETAFFNWQGDYQQTDDVCVIGIRV